MSELLFSAENKEDSFHKDPFSGSKVKVGLRIRPLVHKELMENSLKCIECVPNTSQIIIGKDKSFTFDRIYDENSTQEEIFHTFVKELVTGCFYGYNATILAYGQTGSGKTYTMGSAMALKPEDNGIIYRVIKEIFNEIEHRKSKAEFLIKVSYLEIYNEEIYDLLDTSLTSSARNRLSKPNSSINIREEKDGSINIYGINEEKVLTYEEMISCLERGSMHRSTASTLMNEVSSRSHAIFTITLEQHIQDDQCKAKTPCKIQSNSLSMGNNNQKTLESSGFISAKFHFVDLAGSERIKKTGASGNIMKEGININRGLLVLGNVISALTDTTSKFIHVPYRESKLTRILQDSLGGNSLTGMIACVSPAESNYEESLNTIKYANRARNIQNTPHINRDPQSAMISQLKQQIFELTNENSALKQVLSASNIKWDDAKATSRMNSLKMSISPLMNKSMDLEQDDIRNIKIKLVQAEKLNKKLQAEVLSKQKALNEIEISLLTITKERDLFRLHYEKNNLNFSLKEIEDLDLQNKQTILETYKQEIEKMKQEIKKKDEFTKELQIEYEHLLVSSRKDQDLLLEKICMLNKFQKQIRKLEYQKESTQESDKNSQEEGMVVEDDEEWLVLEKEMASIKAAKAFTETELNSVSGTLLEKEELLKKFTENNIELERSLVEIMKNQYHNKISCLEGEMAELIAELKKIESERDKALIKLNHNQGYGDPKTREFDEKNKLIAVSYKNKILQLENQLKDFRKKETDEQNLKRLVQNQKNKINELAQEIKNIRQQKLQLNKKYREELDKLEKLKNITNKERLDWKKKEQEKNLQITKLKNEKEKMISLIKKKDEEIVNNKKTQEHFRNICNKDFKQFQDPKSLMLKRYNTRKHVEIFGEGDLLDENILCILEGLQYKVLEIFDWENKLINEESELKRTQTDLEQEGLKLSELLLKKEKIFLSYNEKPCDIEEEEAFQRQKNVIEAQINDINMRIENLEDKTEFIKRKIIEITRKIQKFDNINEILTQFLNNEKNNHKLLTKGLLEKWTESLNEIVKLKEEIKKKGWEIKEISTKYSNLELKYNQDKANFQQIIQKIKQEFEAKQLKMLKKQDLYNLCSKESGDISKNNSDKAKILQNDKMEIETNDKPNDIKIISFKEKRQLIRQEKMKNNENKENKPKETSASKINVNEAINLKQDSPPKKRELHNEKKEAKFHTISQRKTLHVDYKTPELNFFPEFKDFSSCDFSFLEGKEQNYSKYNCVYKFNTYSPITSLQILDKILFVASGKKIHIMDLEFNRIINEFQIENCDIKSLNINREKNLLIYSYENYIEMRDLGTYQKVDCLKARTPELKDIFSVDFFMASAGKGSISRGALMLWDLRKRSWICETEKNSDISKILLKDKILYYGGSEKILKRLNTETGMNIYPYIQKHTDSIISIAGLTNHIITGAKDKTLKLWNANSFIENCTDSVTLDKSFVSAFDVSNCFSNIFYSGESDGSLNVWNLNSEKIKKIYNLENAHSNSITSIVESNIKNSNFMITGSKDEILKILKPGDEIFGVICENS